MDDSMLEQLDILERHPTGYTRLPIQIEVEASSEGQNCNNEGSKVLECQGYKFCDFNESLMDLPQFDNFKDSVISKEAYSVYYEDEGKKFWKCIKNSKWLSLNFDVAASS